jgi:hypothetical protein
MADNTHSTKRSPVQMILFFVVPVGFLLWLIIPRVVKNQLYVDLSFYLTILIILAWFGLVFGIINLSQKYLRDEKKDLMKILTAVMFVMGIPGSLILGDVLCQQGVLFILVYFLLLLMILLLYVIWLQVRFNIKHNTGEK